MEAVRQLKLKLPIIHGYTNILASLERKLNLSFLGCGRSGGLGCSVLHVCRCCGGI